MASSSIPSFDSRKQKETMAGRKRAKATMFEDYERKTCSKLALPDAQRIIGLVEELNEKCKEKDVDQWTMWHLQLKIAKEMAEIASRLLQPLDQVADLEELSMDTVTDMIPLIDEMICECQDTILEATPEKPLELWTPNTERDKATDALLDNAVATMNMVLDTVFKSKKRLRADERYDLLHACCALFQASDSLVKSATGDGEHIMLEERLDYMFDDAIAKCDDQTLDEYFDCYEEEDEEEDD